MEEKLHERTPILSGYQLRLPTYEGPLDVLLRLIERSQLAIEDVSLVKVTDQFLAYIDKIGDAPPDTVADFTAVGARLTVLKSRSLLPRPVLVEEELEQSNLTVQLRDYKRIKDAARRLGEAHAAGMHAYASGNNGAISSLATSQTARIAPHEPDLLVRSLRRRLGMVPKAMQLIKQRRTINLRAVVDLISALVSRTGLVRFGSVVRHYQTRTEVATAFMAVLTLIRHQTLDASQAGLFGDISLRTPRQPPAPESLNGAHDDAFTG